MTLDDMARAAFDLLAHAPGARSDPEGTAQAVEAALAAAPHELDVRLGAYRFYFYTHQYALAIPQAEAILALAAQRLNIAADWREVRPGDAAFPEAEIAPGLYLQALIALAYCQMRLGRFDLGEPCLAKVRQLDPADRFGAARLVAAARRPDPDED